MYNLKEMDDRFKEIEIIALDTEEVFFLSEMEEDKLYQINVDYNCYSDYVLFGKQNQNLFCIDVWETEDATCKISYTEDWQLPSENPGKVTRIKIPFMQENYSDNKEEYEESFGYCCDSISTLFDAYNYYISYGTLGIDTDEENIVILENTHICDAMQL